ncbi:hypothetical protein FRC01_014122, partial [Tulasnella sp. 417]
MPHSPNGSAFQEDLSSGPPGDPFKTGALDADMIVEKLEAASSQETVHYRLYKRRFIGATAL